MCMRNIHFHIHVIKDLKKANPLTLLSQEKCFLEEFKRIQQGMKQFKVIQNQLRGSARKGNIVQSTSAAYAEILPTSILNTEEKLASRAEYSSSKQSSQSATLHTFAYGIKHVK